MSECMVYSEDLDAVANAIKAKAGINTSLLYPTEFISGIQSIKNKKNLDEIEYVEGGIS